MGLIEAADAHQHVAAAAIVATRAREAAAATAAAVAAARREVRKVALHLVRLGLRLRLG